MEEDWLGLNPGKVELVSEPPFETTWERVRVFGGEIYADLYFSNFCYLTLSWLFQGHTSRVISSCSPQSSSHPLRECSQWDFTLSGSTCFPQWLTPHITLLILTPIFTHHCMFELLSFALQPFTPFSLLLS